MSAATNEYLAAIEQMDAGAVLRVDDVPWEEYEQLLADMGDGYAVRVFYDRGRMEIMAPSSDHERPKNVVHTLIGALRDELDIDIESLGSTTLKVEMKAKGAEPDDCFYIQNAALVIGRIDLDLKHDPPPDLVIEIDHTSSSLDKFSIYAGLAVPEIWRVAKGKVRIFLLNGETYEERPASGAFSFLPAHTISEFLARGLAEGQRKVAIAFRAWVREHRSEA